MGVFSVEATPTTCPCSASGFCFRVVGGLCTGDGGCMTAPTVVASVDVNASPARAWEVVTTLLNHERWIPWTRISAPDRPLRLGDRVTAVSVGVIVDRMVVTANRNRESRIVPGEFDRRITLTKVGPLLMGQADLVVLALSRNRARIMWGENIAITTGKGALSPALAWTVPLSRAALTPFFALMVKAALAKAAGDLDPS